MLHYRSEMSWCLQQPTVGCFGKREMSDYTETAQVYQERKVNESCLERNRWSQNWFFPPNFSISLKVFDSHLFLFWKLHSHNTFGISQIFSCCPNFSLTIKINLLCCNCFCKSAHTFIGRRYNPNKQSPKHLICKMIFLPHKKINKKTNVFQLRIAKIRFPLDFKYPSVFIISILSPVSVMPLEVGKRRILPDSLGEREAASMHSDGHTKMPRASVNPEGPPSASHTDTSLWCLIWGVPCGKTSLNLTEEHVNRGHLAR